MPSTPSPDPEALRRWRLLLGAEAEPALPSMGGGPGEGGGAGGGLDEADAELDRALAALYDGGDGSAFSYPAAASSGPGSGKGRQAGRGGGAGQIARWLGDIRKYFPKDLVSVVQADAIERKGLASLLLEPESLANVTPDLGMVTTLMALKDRIPEKAKQAAREIVQRVVDEVDRRLADDLRRAVVGALNRRAHSPIPSAAAVDWKRTIGRNLGRYHAGLQRLVPERFFFFDRARRRSAWTVIVDMDQSGSMAESVVYGSIAGCVLAKMASLRTHVVAFDENVVDLTAACGSDPVDMIFGVQLGGGTNIEKSVAYCERFVLEPSRTFFLLISDLCEGGNQARLVARLSAMRESGVKVMALLALSDGGAPYYDERLAARLAGLGIPAFAATPAMLPPLIEAVLKGREPAEVVKTLTAKRS